MFLPTRIPASGGLQAPRKNDVAGWFRKGGRGTDREIGDVGGEGDQRRNARPAYGQNGRYVHPNVGCDGYSSRPRAAITTFSCSWLCTFAEPVAGLALAGRPT